VPARRRDEELRPSLADQEHLPRRHRAALGSSTTDQTGQRAEELAEAAAARAAEGARQALERPNQEHLKEDALKVRDGAPREVRDGRLPGVREIHQAVQRAVELAGDGVVDVASLALAGELVARLHVAIGGELEELHSLPLERRIGGERGVDL